MTVPVDPVPPGALAVAARAMASTPHRWASLVALDVLRAGGGAVDAAIAAGAALMVALPQQCGPGGDAFWLIREPGRRTVALNASGRAPAAADPEVLRAAGHEAIPRRSAWAVTVPGAVDGWRAAHERFGRLPLDRLLAPAIEAAERGVAVTPLLARVLRDVAPVLEARAESRRIFAGAGPVLAQPDLAATLRTVAADPRALYEGPLAAAVAAAVQAEGGGLSAEDLAGHESEWTAPLSAPFAGWTVEEMPPNSQGVAALAGLRVLARAGLPDPGDDGAWLDRGVRAARVLMTVRDAEVADPAAMRRPAEELFGDDYLDRLPAGPPPGPAAPAPLGDTVHIAVIDEDGMAVSCIQSLFDSFGTGIVVPGTGMLLHNRGCGFSLDPERPNVLTAGLRPMHTLAPAMAAAPDGRLAAFGCMGGHAQAQVHVQLVGGMAGQGLDPAAAVARARWVVEGEAVLAEDRGRLPDRLATLGYAVRRIDPYAQAAGHAQVVVADTRSGTLLGAADARSDGAALGY